MCGYIGKFSKKPIDYKHMDVCNELQICRGPDEKKLVTDTVSNIFDSKNNNYFSFVFNRLRILDFSEYSSQPMFSKEFNSSIMFNGEIYNYIELRKQLLTKGYRFRTHSDTEVLLNMFIEYGSEMLNMLNGIFAFAIFDKKSKQLFLARDHFGVKPLYFFSKNNFFVFASEIKGILAHPKVKFHINQEKLR